MYLHTHKFRRWGSGGAFPLLATRSVRPVISLASLQTRSAVANPPPSSTEPSQLPLGAVSDPFHVDEVEEEMDASYSMLHSPFSEAGVGQDGQPSDLSTPPDLRSYDHILIVSSWLIWESQNSYSGIYQYPVLFGSWIKRSRSNRGLGPEYRPGHGGRTDQGFSGACDDEKNYKCLFGLQGPGGTVYIVV